MTGSRRARSRGPADAAERTLRLLAVRWRSRKELARRLRLAGFEESEIERVLEELETAGLIDDARFARELTRSQAYGRLAANRAIQGALREKGVPSEVAEEALGAVADTEAARALELAIRRGGRFAELPAEVAARRLFGILQRRGYPPGVARSASLAALAALRPGTELPDGG